MADIVSKKVRSRMMSGIKGRDTKPEVLVRKSLHALGYRYSLHYKGLPGRPDIVLPKYKAVILVNGCFWHGHGCHLFKWPHTRTRFWKEKIEGNIERDERNIETYHKLGWKVAVVWECALKGRSRLDLSDVITRLDTWIRDEKENIEIIGDEDIGGNLP